MVLQAIFGAAFSPEGYSFEELEKYIKLGTDATGFYYACSHNPRKVFFLQMERDQAKGSQYFPGTSHSRYYAIALRVSISPSIA